MHMGTHYVIICSTEKTSIILTYSPTCPPLECIDAGSYIHFYLALLNAAGSHSSLVTPKFMLHLKKNNKKKEVKIRQPVSEMVLRQKFSSDLTNRHTRGLKGR